MNPRHTWTLVTLAFLTLGFILFFEKSTQKKEIHPQKTAALIHGLNLAGLSSIEVLVRSNQAIRVEQTNREWAIVAPFSYPANQHRIDSFLSALNQIIDRDHISAEEIVNQRQSLSAYGLEPPQATVVIKSDRGRYEINIGSRTPMKNQLYLQLVGIEGVFFVNANLWERIPQTVDDWRHPSVTQINPSQFNRIRIQYNTAPGMEFALDNSTQLWRLISPINARANHPKILNVVSQLSQWQVKRFLPEAPKTNLSDYGLQPPEMTLSFASGTNDIAVVQFGKNPTNDSSVVYCRTLPYSTIFLILKEQLDILRSSYVDFRDQRLISMPLQIVDNIEIKGSENIILEKHANSNWFISSPFSAPADPDLMNQFLGNLSTLPICEFVKDVVTDFSEYGLTQPSFSLVLKSSLTNNPTTSTNQIREEVLLGNTTSNKVYARISTDNSVYGVRSSDVKKLSVLAYQLRDRRIWDFQTNQVTSMTISIRGDSRKILRNSSGQWILDQDTTPLTSPFLF